MASSELDGGWHWCGTDSTLQFWVALYAVSVSSRGIAASPGRETGSAPSSGRGFVPGSTPRPRTEGTEPVTSSDGDRLIGAIEDRLPPGFVRR